jgi:hypothetical protein
MNQRKKNPTFWGTSGSLNTSQLNTVIPVKTRKIVPFFNPLKKTDPTIILLAIM